MTRRILLVDDEQNTLLALQRELRDWSRDQGVEVRATTDPAEALALLAAAPDEYQLVISDLRMPQMKGSDLLLEVKERWPRIMSILLTGYSETGEVMKAVKAGIFSYILKPWDRDYLLQEIGKALEVYRIREENALHARRMEQELRWAGEMQRAFLRMPAVSGPAAGGVTFDLHYRPVSSLHCGGDYYDVISLPGSRLLVLLGDVAGHGVTGALVTGVLKSIIEPEFVMPAGGTPSPAALLHWLNARLCAFMGTTSSLLVTMVAAVLDPAGGTLTFANAGHVPPLMVRRGAAAQSLDSTGPALGFMPDAVYTETAESFGIGDLLFMYTDGLVESGTAMVSSGIDTLRTMLAAVPDPAALGAAAIARQVLAARGTTEFEDDVTVLRALRAGGTR
jgi:phosphoserine phosphatase RsbU/P